MPYNDTLPTESDLRKALEVLHVARLISGSHPIAQQGDSGESAASTHPFVGRYVLLRCKDAGVHSGVLVSQNGDQAVLRHSRRLWRWKAVKGIALSGVAVHGLSKDGWSKIDTEVTDISLTGVIETILCTPEAEESIRGY